MWAKIFQLRVILSILLLAFILRIYDINNNPKSMYGDSLTLVYDAYSILKTGHDQTGQFLPLFFSMGGGRPAGYIYATIPFVAIFGPTPLAARSISILSGVGVALLLYLICSQILSKRIGIYAAFLASLTPWELSLSRGAFETHFALFLGLVGLYFFNKSKDNKLMLLPSGLSFALSMQTYSTYVLTVVLFVIILLIDKALSESKQVFFNLQIIIFLSLVILSLLFSVYISFSRGDKDRFSNLLIFNQPQIQNEISSKVQAYRSYSLLKPELAKRLHNRFLENISVLMENYAKSFGLEFLFLKGDKNPRHNPANMGELYLICLPLIILGFVFIYLKSKKLFYFLSLWAAIGPLAASLVGPPHALRSSFLLPPLLILSACGIEKVKRGKVILFIIFLIQFSLFLERFFFLSPNLNASFWSYNAEKASEVAIENKKKYDYIILSTSIPDMEFAYPVYAKIEPSQALYQKTHKSTIQGFSFSKFDNVFLGVIPSGEIKKVMGYLEGSVLYLGPLEDRGKVDNEGIQRDENGAPMYVISKKLK